ncbi:hypothetical protein [Sediminivirga luteola]|uniref:Amidohydrolase family protein n=1 Tax=Sediminivirga luteola TaxID=1774748 RepID=A0A8J2XJU6_9MICO|nr:hypothetical protein [Sediminivirga luteola]MCI2264049.1 hypothetical protein [Sediminivirga luteola]GGA22760.1 hypothetical protein GCM10011333_27190 [Sediminivirga luteola]
MPADPTESPEASAQRAHPASRAYQGAEIYNRVDPFATALVTERDTIAWLGSDEAVRVITADQPVDLAGCLIAPPFVNAWAEVPAGPDGAGDADEAAALAAAGGVEVLMLVHREPSAAMAAAGHGERADGIELRHALRLPAGDLLALLEASAVAAAVQSSRLLPVAEFEEADAGLLPRLLELLEPGRGLAFEVRDEAGLAALVAAGRELESARPGAIGAGGHRLRAHTPLGEHAEAVAALGLAVTIDPLAGRHDFAEGLAAGAVLSLGWDPARSPWEVLRALVFPPGGVTGSTARAAFTAATKGGWRALDGAGLGAGRAVLAPGAPASFAIWEAGDLVVQAADQRVAAWSTDPRAGTPGLPDLSPGRTLPRLREFVIGGRRVI